MNDRQEADGRQDNEGDEQIHLPWQPFLLTASAQNQSDGSEEVNVHLHWNDQLRRLRLPYD